ncbi:lysozyme [Runella sp. SP2]|uniref:lysozyme n=1 Tax=Runella sp. SP2 TaxID=2268026 RepID=UPI000F08CB15|nr:lysozyme [Runella sp. SP2]AYQ31976.1 lysozyme [Runella sp. SP2]
MATTSAAGILHIKQYENAKLIPLNPTDWIKAYWDSNGYAIGWGSRFDLDGSKITSDQICTIKYANMLLNKDVKAAETAVNNAVKVDLTQGQFDALVDFVYQFGATAFSTSTLLKVVNSTPNDFTAVAAQLRRWVNVNGQVSTSIQKRREANIIQYTSGGAVQSVAWLWAVIVAVLAFSFFKFRNR